MLPFDHLMVLFGEDQKIWLLMCSHMSARDGDSLEASAEEPNTVKKKKKSEIE